MDMDTRLRVARGVAKTEREASQRVFETLKRRGHPDAPPPLVSDGWGGIDEAMVEVYGVVPEHQGIGRPPTRKQLRAGWQHLQVVKQRENGRVVGATLRVILGSREEVLRLLGKSTVYVERTHLTMRLFHGRLTRKTRAFSKGLEMDRASATWEDLVCNLACPLKTLRLEISTLGRRWLPRSLAMAAGRTDHLWTVKELLWTVVLPVNT